MRELAARARFVLFACSIGACATPPSLTQEQFCEQMLAIQCTSLACCTNGAPRAACPTDPVYLTSRCRLLVGDPRYTNPNETWDGVGAAAAIDRLRQEAASCAPASAADQPAAFVRGRGTVGSDCSTGVGALTRSGVCAQGTTCIPTMGRCGVLGNVGDPCTGDDGCIAGLYCPFSQHPDTNGEDAGPPTCAVRVPDDGPCDSIRQTHCASGRCAFDAGHALVDDQDAGLMIVPGNCAPALADGEHCGQYDICASGYCVNHVCVTLDVVNTQYCQPPVPLPGYNG